MTDSTPAIQGVAEDIAAVINGNGFSGYVASTTEAGKFSGNELLPAYAIFIGCELPKPDSFAYIDDLFKHICLAGRPCGIFSSKAETLKYLSGLICESEALLGIPLLIQDDIPDKNKLKKWVQGVLKAEEIV
jgi:hypothetical protein